MSVKQRLWLSLNMSRGCFNDHIHNRLVVRLAHHVPVSIDMDNIGDDTDNPH
jgi:hypothetical protein